MTGTTAEATMNATTTETTAVDELLRAVRAGTHGRVPELVADLDGAARKTALARLTELRKEVRGWGWDRWDEQRKVRHALRVAGAGCHTGPAAAATWIAARDLSDWGDTTLDGLLRVLADREPSWLANVAQRLAERPSVAEDEYRLVHALVVRSGCPVPTTEAYLRGWTRSLTNRRLVDLLRDDPQTPVLLPHVLALTDMPDRLTWTVGPEQPTHWPTALKTLADEGMLDRAVLVDGCVSRLLRGGRPRDLRFPLTLLRLLGTTDEERRSRIPDWLGMAADAPSPVAGYAQEVLAELALDGGLAVPELAEMSGAVLFRSEKKLVRAQLTLLGKVLRRERGAAAELLPVVADAFGHEDTTVQERALALVARHLKDVQDERVRQEVAGAAELLSPVHRAAAAELFGSAALADDAPYVEVLPPVPERRPVAPAAESLAELMEDLVALVRRPYDSLEEFERALDGVVRHARRDREALTALVRETFADTYGFVHGDHVSSGSQGLLTVLAALAGKVGVSRLDAARRRPGGTPSCAHEALTRSIDARVWEVAWLLATAAPVPFLLATPTDHTGSVDPSVLVERLRAYQAAGVDPLPLDMAQALLRVRKADPRAAAAASEAEALGTGAGGRLARWLTADESLAPGLRFLERGRDRSSGRWWLADRLVVAVRERRAIRDEFPPAFQWLGGSPTEIPRRCGGYHWSGLRPLWPGILPDDRETLAAWLLPTLAGGAEWEERDAAWGLTALAEADGPVGPAVHLALAVGLGCRHVEDRLTAVDALLVLASRGELDPSLLAARLAGLVADGTVKPNRLADAARTAAATGAYGTVREVLLGLLPSVLAAPKPVRGAGELLAVAAECVERSGGCGQEVAGLAEVAARRGATQLVTQARRLAAALGRWTGGTPSGAAPEELSAATSTPASGATSTPAAEAATEAE
ncbi:DUF6493 family protein [Streptomyces roseicoloratus]|uniref:DUF7824 domain-containing protein n=1 Tax=Streptomyces roseicoloratus TaxID=2508722 RepID=UPI0015E17768|nr:DUF6493 family protein [Streptomyces roseicoloratus]